MSGGHHKSDKKRVVDQDDTLKFDLTFIQPTGSKYEMEYAEDMSLLLNLDLDNKLEPHAGRKTTDMDNLLEEGLKTNKHEVTKDRTKDKSINNSSAMQRRKNESQRSGILDENARKKDRPNSVINRNRRAFGGGIAREEPYSGGRQDNESGNNSKVLKKPEPSRVAAFDLSKPIGLRSPVLRNGVLGRGMYGGSMGPMYFNVLCVGKERVGKSVFLEELIFKIFNKKQVVDRKEQTFVEYVSERKDKTTGARYLLNCIDSKGYSDSYPVDQWYSDLKTFIQGKSDAYSELRELSGGRGTSSMHLPDPRIHLCLYFIDSSSRLNVKDVLHLKKLKKLVNIIPVMVGQDPEVDSEEIEAYKDRLNKDARDYEIEWLDLQLEVPHLEAIITKFNLNPIAPCPPFWYQAEVNEDTESVVLEDFKLLSTLLSGPISAPLIYRSNILYEVNKETRDRSRDNKKTAADDDAANIKFGLGMAVGMGMGALGFIMAVKNKIF